MATGLIAELGNEAHLAERISWLVENEAARLNMGNRARLMMEQEFELGKQTDCHQTLYENVGQSSRVARVA